MIKTIFYVPNLLNYARFILLIVVVFSIGKNPLRAFILNLIAGNLDMIDGMYARSFGQGSKFGAFMDHGMDRLATSIMFVYLAVRYKKIWYVFLTVQFVELVMDILMAYLKHYRSVVNLLKINSITDDSQMIAAFRQELGEQAVEERILDAKSEQLGHQSVINFFLQLVWYSGDAFYWILYSYLFIEEKSGILAAYQNYLQSFLDGIINLTSRYFPRLFSFNLGLNFIRAIFMIRNKIKSCIIR
ncbi:CDP-diacylglycerol-inositol 3-phosphatidyltransferase [Brachionus plicatilis]|uniref:CDP-diacylglycerol-inositol 3-phosphatidyltransferase n=1 Tax=Brachionus plicatilis TaxID=10195 RepID=A0A3M7P8I1_BRAPC|nr:CDP-diacylglycerol-inositol 3-phosphatidyltransferase [Brachionus plicatilis]